MEDADCINMLGRLSNWEYSAATPYLKNCPNQCVCVWRAFLPHKLAPLYVLMTLLSYSQRSGMPVDRIHT